MRGEYSGAYQKAGGVWKRLVDRRALRLVWVRQGQAEGFLVDASEKGRRIGNLWPRAGGVWEFDDTRIRYRVSLSTEGDLLYVQALYIVRKVRAKTRQRTG